jgi:transcriptional regulator with XRE-family HTH domain
MQVDVEKFVFAMARGCLSVRELCVLSGVSAVTVLRIRNGNQVRPSTVGRVARALGLDVDELLESKPQQLITRRPSKKTSPEQQQFTGFSARDEHPLEPGGDTRC